MSEQILNCDICNAPMTYFPQGTFKCTKCEQSWSFSNESISRLILKRMYPQKMDSAMHHEFIDYKVSEFLFEQKGLLISGLIDQVEFDKRKAQVVIDAEKAHQAVPIKKSWKFWKKCNSVSEKGSEK